MAEKELACEVGSRRTYVFIWLCLVWLTAVTVVVARLHLTGYAVVTAMVIATAKAGLVATFFMNLKQEPLILKIMLSLVLIALTLIVLLTFSDVSYRHG